MAAGNMDVLQGTLDMLVLKTLTWRPMHGYDILDWLRRTTRDELRIEDAALYPALHRLEARELVESEWGLSANNRRAKYYTLTTKGRRALRNEAVSWSRYVSIVGRVMSATESEA
jgi:PadR family transcriptional regulator, regulatory protein PadR